MKHFQNKLKTLKPNSCSCSTCQAMCQRPCWGTPQDIQRLIDAGYGDRLMQDGWFGGNYTCNENDLKILSPALKGFEGKQTSFIPRSQEGCTFFKDGLCELHDLGLKPSEGALSSCRRENTANDVPTLHEEIAMTWDTEEGKQMAEQWRAEHNVSKTFEHDPLEIMMGGFQMALLGMIPFEEALEPLDQIIKMLKKHLSGINIEEKLNLINNLEENEHNK